jgi:hypothetical protein
VPPADQGERRRRIGHDQLRSETEQFLPQRAQGGEIASGTNIDADVLAFDPAQRAESAL